MLPALTSAASAMSAVGDIAGGVGSVLGLFGGGGSSHAARQQLADQQQFSWKMRRQAYQDTVADLKDAGLNPMLAFSNGPTQLPGGGTPGPVVQKALVGAQTAQAINSARVSNASVDQINAQTRLTDAQTAKTNAETPNIEQQTVNLKEAVPKIRAEIAQVLESKQLMYQQGLSEIDKRNLMTAQAHLAKADEAMRTYQTWNFEADTEMKKAITILRQLEIPMARNLANYANSAMGKAEPYARGAQEYGGAVGSTLGGAIGGAAKVFQKKPPVTIINRGR